MYLRRSITNKLQRISKLYPVLLVTGPRQVGKTELVRHFFNKHRYVLLDSPSVVGQAKNDPKLFLLNNPAPVVFDEVQRAPELFLELKSFVDLNKPEPGSIVLTGSQPFHLMDKVSDSLSGRIGIVELSPMTHREIAENNLPNIEFGDLLADPPIGESFPWKSAPINRVFRGGLPLMALESVTPFEIDVQQRLSDYVKTYLTKDLREQSWVKDLAKFERFLRVIASYSGQIANLSEVSRKAETSQSTGEEWLSLIEASHLHTRLAAYSANLGKRETKRPKYFTFDSGLQLNLLGYTSSAQIEHAPVFGQAIETAVVSSIRSYISASNNPAKLFHWRYSETEEVDLVIELRSGATCPIEIKATASPTTHATKGIENFIARTKTAEFGCVISCNDKCFWLTPKTLHLPWSMF